MNTNSELFKRAYLSLVLADDNTLLPNVSYKNFIHFPYIKDGESNGSYYSVIFVDIKENENKQLAKYKNNPHFTFQLILG